MSKHTKVVFLTAALLFLGACGGGQVAGTGGMGGTGVQVVSNGVMTKGSVVVNGVRYEDTTANISIDDTPKIAADLQDGMVVSVRGTASGSSGTAQSVVAQSEVRGLVTAVFDNENPPRIVVLGQNVLIDDQTFLNGITSPISAVQLLPSVVVEVHGLRDTLGNIRATRVEAEIGLMGGDDSVDEIRGVVSNRAGDTFNIGNQVVLIGTAMIVPIGAMISNGIVVEVHCTLRPCTPGGVFQASRIEVEDGSNLPGNGQRFEVEGLISGFVVGGGDFFVAGISVITTDSTRFEGGLAGDLLNDIKVEAEGTWNGTTLMASKIEFKRSVIRLQGLVTESNPGAGTFRMDISGLPLDIETDSFTDGIVPGISLPPLDSSNCVQVRGQRKAGGVVVVVAGEIRVGGCSNSGRPVLQALVEAENGFELRLLGFDIDAESPTDTTDPGSTGYENIDGSPMTRAAFFSAVVPADSAAVPPVAGTLVKVIFNDTGGTVHEVELED